MLHFNFAITNPWSQRWKTIFFKHGLVSQHKAWEFNCYKTHHLIDIDVSLTTRTDHSGLNLMLGLLGYSVEFCFYDTRHWPHEEV